ncbi:MAG: hypothetical protein HY841_07360 [Bacteroidetes bacterium]|nr:hypothetical protein [Bacteroidota bacterium]
MKAKVKLGLSRMSVPEMVEFALHVVSRMTGNAFFPSPSPSLGNLYNAAIALQNAFDQAQGSGPAQTAVMHQKREVMETELTAEGHYVEDVANDPANSVTGPEAIILSAGMDVKDVTPRQKRVFTVSNGNLPGTVELVAERAVRGSHEWQYTQDLSDPNSWIDAESTTQASVTVSGLESGKRYWFRHRAILPDGPTDYDGPVDIIVQ